VRVCQTFGTKLNLPYGNGVQSLASYSINMISIREKNLIKSKKGL